MICVTCIVTRVCVGREDDDQKITVIIITDNKYYCHCELQTVTLQVCKKFEPEAWSFCFLAMVWLAQQSHNASVKASQRKSLERVETPLVASCYCNWDKLQPDWPLGICRLYLHLV